MIFISQDINNFQPNFKGRNIFDKKSSIKQLLYAKKYPIDEEIITNHFLREKCILGKSN